MDCVSQSIFCGIMTSWNLAKLPIHKKQRGKDIDPAPYLLIFIIHSDRALNLFTLWFYVNICI